MMYKMMNRPIGVPVKIVFCHIKDMAIHAGKYAAEIEICQELLISYGCSYKDTQTYTSRAERRQPMASRWLVNSADLSCAMAPGSYVSSAVVF